MKKQLLIIGVVAAIVICILAAGCTGTTSNQQQSNQNVDLPVGNWIELYDEEGDGIYQRLTYTGYKFDKSGTGKYYLYNYDTQQYESVDLTWECDGNNLTINSLRNGSSHTYKIDKTNQNYQNGTSGVGYTFVESVTGVRYLLYDGEAFKQDYVDVTNSGSSKTTTPAYSESDLYGMWEYNTDNSTAQLYIGDDGSCGFVIRELPSMNLTSEFFGTWTSKQDDDGKYYCFMKQFFSDENQLGAAVIGENKDKLMLFYDMSDTSKFLLLGKVNQFTYQTETTKTTTTETTATLGEQNALKSAKSYLKSQAFSYNGLIEQLEYEKYTHTEAVYAADNCGADWNEQAKKSAASYIKYQAFSKEGLIEQLEYEGFTHDQAVIGAASVGYT